MRTFVGAILFVGGILLAGGSANDCDGACMEQANTLGEMVTFSLLGLLMMMCGVLALMMEDRG